MSFLSAALAAPVTKDEVDSSQDPAVVIPKIAEASVELSGNPAPAATPPAPVADDAPVIDPAIVVPSAPLTEKKDEPLVDDKKDDKKEESSTVDENDGLEPPKGVKAANKMFAEFRQAKRELKALTAEKTEAAAAKKTLEDKIAALEAKPQSAENDKRIAELEAKLSANEKEVAQKAEEFTRKQSEIAAREQSIERRELANRVYTSRPYQQFVVEPHNNMLKEIDRIAKVEAGEEGPELAAVIKAALALPTPDERYAALKDAAADMSAMSLGRLGQLFDINERIFANNEKIMADSEKTKADLDREEKEHREEKFNTKNKQFQNAAVSVREAMKREFPIFLPEHASKYPEVMSSVDAYIQKHSGRALTPEEVAKAVVQNAHHYALHQITLKSLVQSEASVSQLAKENAELKAKLEAINGSATAEAERKAKEAREAIAGKPSLGAAGKATPERPSSFVQAVMNAKD